MHLPLPALIAIAAGLLGLSVAAVIYRYITTQSAGSTAMQELAGLIEQGAMAFLRREYTVLGPFILAVALLLGWAVGAQTALAYIFGGLCSITAGLFGMKAATKANVRTAEAARASGQASALRIAFNGGAVMGLAVAALGLVGIGIVTALVMPQGSVESLTEGLQPAFVRFSQVIKIGRASCRERV